MKGSLRQYQVRVTVRAQQDYTVTASSERAATDIAEQIATKDGYRGFDIVDFDTEVIS